MAKNHDMQRFEEWLNFKGVSYSYNPRQREYLIEDTFYIEVSTIEYDRDKAKEMVREVLRQNGKNN